MLGDRVPNRSLKRSTLVYSVCVCVKASVYKGTKTDSETALDSETRDSETARRIQKLHVGPCIKRLCIERLRVKKGVCVGVGVCV